MNTLPGIIVPRAVGGGAPAPAKNNATDASPISAAPAGVSGSRPISASVSFRVNAGACSPHLQPAGAHSQQQRPLAPLEVAQLCELFNMFDGAIPKRELIAEGFDVADLVARGAVMPPQSHLDFDFYFVGETLRKAVQTK